MSVEMVVRCRPWSREGVQRARVLVHTDGSVTVFDSIAGHFTGCHSLGESAVRRIRRLANIESA